MRNGIPIIIALLLIFGACSNTQVLNQNEVYRSGQSASDIVAKIPDYSDRLHSLSGQGKTIVSEPGGTERATVYFSGNRQKSLITIKNNLGIEGGQLLASGDSLLIYNKVDKMARKVAISEHNLSQLDRLASLNVLDLINYTFPKDEVRRIYENDHIYLLQMRDERKIYVGKKRFAVRQVDLPADAGAPYSRLVYDGYAEIGGFILPRRVTIFSADKKSKVSLLIQSLQLNPDSVSLNVDIPDNVTVTHQ